MKRWLWYAVAVAIVIFYKIAWRLLLPFMLALAIAVAVRPVVTWLSRRTKINRTVATIVVFLLVALLGTAAVFWATAALVQGTATFIDKLPDYQATFMHQADVFLAWASRVFVNVNPEVLKIARGNIDQLIQTGRSMLNQLGQLVLAGLGALPGLASLLLIAILAGFFLTKDWEWFVSGFLKLLPAEWRRVAERTGSNVGRTLAKYALAQLLLISISTVLSLIGLALIGAERWPAAGLVAGALDLLPVLGPGLLYIPWAIYSFIVGKYIFGISLLVVYAVVSGVRQVSEAKVVGQSIGIHPLIMIIGLYWGALLLGPKGLIIAPLLLIVGKAYLDVRDNS